MSGTLCESAKTLDQVIDMFEEEYPCDAATVGFLSDVERGDLSMARVATLPRIYSQL